MRYHVLIVEDEATLLHGLMRGLQSMPTLQVTGCASAEEALTIMHKDPPDLLITDLNLPGRSGLALIQELEKRSLWIPVIVTTAYHNNFAEQLHQHQNLTIIEKPVGMSLLRKVIEEKLSQHTALTSLGPFQLVDYLQLAGYGRHSLLLHFELIDDRRGYLEIVKGNIWNAYIGELAGEDALSVLMQTPLRNLGYATMDYSPRSRQIERSWEEVLLDLARMHDEASRENDEVISADGLIAVLYESMDSLPAMGSLEEELDWDDLHDKATQIVEEKKEEEKAPTLQQATRLNKVCQNILENIDDGLACGLVDLNSGMLMGVYHTIPYFTQSYLDAVAAAAVDMFRGKNVRRIEQLISKHRVQELEDTFEEAFISSETTFHFMKVIAEKNAVVVLITKKTTNQGMGWAGLRNAVSEIIDAV